LEAGEGCRDYLEGIGTVTINQREPWIGELPIEWRKLAIKRIVSTKITDGPHETPELSDNGVQFISAEAIKNNRIDFNLRRGFISQELHEQYSRKCKPQKDDLFVVKSGATTGNVAYVDVDFEFSIWSPLALIRCEERIALSRFVYYVLLSDVFRKQVELSWSFGTQQNIGMGVIERLKIPIPPISEQQRIAEFLESSCAAIEAVIVAKQQQLKILDGIRRDVVQRAVTRGIETEASLRFTDNAWLAEIPVGWELVSLKRISEIRGGLTLGRVYEGRLVERPYLRVANVQDGHLKLDDVTTIEVPEEVAQGVALRSGDVLMTEGGDLDKLGRGTLWTGEIKDCLHQNHVFAIRCFQHKLQPSFLAYLTASQYGRDYFEATGKKTTNLASTNSTKVGLFPIPLPPLQDQLAICSFLDARLARVRRTESDIRSQIATLTAYRRSLIHECVTGQWRIEEATISRVKVHG
jgi:type I restriction enzyme S subunit